MDKSIAIHKLAAQLGLTSRTLRHWESEGLFISGRDRDSGWRTYDETAVLRIKLTALLRKLDVPISDIKTAADANSFEKLHSVIQNRLAVLKSDQLDSATREYQLTQFMLFLREQHGTIITEERLSQLSAFTGTLNTFNDSKEDEMMPGIKESGKTLKFVTLPPMRMIYNIAVSVSPEDEAMSPVLNWLELAQLTGTARMFGGNMPPFPKSDETPYGYGFCASIPEGVGVPEHLKEMRQPGGVYAVLESTDDIGASWKELMKLLSNDEKYKSDRSRLCFEEHVRDDMNGFLITLLEPVKAIK